MNISNSHVNVVACVKKNPCGYFYNYLGVPVHVYSHPDLSNVNKIHETLLVLTIVSSGKCQSVRTELPQIHCNQYTVI